MGMTKEAIDLYILNHAAKKQIEEATTDRKSKYNNQKDSRGPVRFDSKKEARRYDELMLMLKAGKIRNLKLQPQFTLQEAFTTPDGEHIGVIRYQADFSYEKATLPDRNGVVYWLPVVEDVKSRGTRTRVYINKKKMMREKFGIDINEV